MTVITRHTYKAETEAGTELPVLGGNLTLDSSAIPYVTASITVPFTGALLDELDPRSGSRVKISATRDGHVETTYTPWVEQGRNIGVNPRGVSSGAGWSPNDVGRYPAVKGVTPPIAHPLGIATAVESRNTGAVVNGVVASIYNPDGLGITGTPQRMLGVWVLVTEAGYRMQAGASGVTWPATEIPANEWTWVQTLTPVAADGYATVYISKITGNAPSTVRAYTTGLLVKAGSSPVGDYFDGSTNPAGELERTRWLGAANATAAVLETRSVTGQEWVPENFRTFDLGIRTARPNRAAGTVTLDLASDEALLADHALLDDLPIQSITLVDPIGIRYLTDLVLGEGIGAELEPGTEDADVTPRFEVTNLLRNPAVAGSTLNWSAAGGCTIAYGSSGSSGYVRVVPNAGAANGAVMAIDSSKFNVAAEPRRLYVFSLDVRAETAGGRGYLGIQYYDRQGALINTGPFWEQEIGVATQRLKVAFEAPMNAAAVAPFFRFTTNRVYRLDNGLLYDGTDDTWYVPGFSGGDAEDGYYTYRFEGPADDSPSVRTPNPYYEQSSETMNWRAGQSGLEFLRGLLMAKGFRLVNDEQRKWSLRRESFRNAGSQTWTWGENLIDVDESISRDDDTWFDAAVYTFSRDGRIRRTDAYGLTLTPTKVFHRRFDDYTSYPGQGRAQNVVERAQGMGRKITVTGIPTWTETTDQPLTVTLDDDTTLTGIAASVRFNFDDDTVTVTTRETEDV
ncbi:hypothetical protein [Microbacterium sp. NPDC055665]